MLRDKRAVDRLSCRQNASGRDTNLSATPSTLPCSDLVMTAFLLIWSPKKWPWPELPDVAKRVAAGVAVADVWGCGFARSILPGDRVFLHRVAQEPKGIFGSGYVTRAPYEVPDPATKRGYRLCIDFVYDWVVDAHEGVVIPRDDVACASVFGADVGRAEFGHRDQAHGGRRAGEALGRAHGQAQAAKARHIRTAWAIPKTSSR